MFWALEQREKRREKLRAEARAAGRAVGWAEGQAEVKQRYVAHLERVAREKGIPLVELLPPETEG